MPIVPIIQVQPGDWVRVGQDVHKVSMVHMLVNDDGSRYFDYEDGFQSSFPADTRISIVRRARPWEYGEE